VVFIFSRYVSLGSILASAAFPLLAFLLPHAPYGPWLAAVVLLVPAIVIVKHRQNIARLWHGTEYRFGKTGTTPT
jgi:acyl phosphate:glycerol-3-phosphate acyltransferase